MLREDEAPERGVDLDRGPGGDILEDDGPGGTKNQRLSPRKQMHKSGSVRSMG